MGFDQPDDYDSLQPERSPKENFKNPKNLWNLIDRDNQFEINLNPISSVADSEGNAVSPLPELDLNFPKLTDQEWRDLVASIDGNIHQSWLDFLDSIGASTAAELSDDHIIFGAGHVANEPFEFRDERTLGTSMLPLDSNPLLASVPEGMQPQIPDLWSDLKLDMDLSNQLSVAARKGYEISDVPYIFSAENKIPFKLDGEYRTSIDPTLFTGHSNESEIDEGNLEP